MQDPASPPAPPRGPSHDDYCRVIGQVVLDSHLRIEQLEARYRPALERYARENRELFEQVALLSTNLRNASRGPVGAAAGTTDEG